MRKKYHGWIYCEKEKGMKDFFTIQYYKFVNSKRHSIVESFGYGEKGAADAVDFFETKQKLGHIQLEPTPIGYRVFTMEPEETKPEEVKTEE